MSPRVVTIDTARPAAEVFAYATDPRASANGSRASWTATRHLRDSGRRAMRDHPTHCAAPAAPSPRVDRHFP
jgi:hypothetical protein